MRHVGLFSGRLLQLVGMMMMMMKMLKRAVLRKRGLMEGVESR